MALKADPVSDKRPSLRKWLRGLRWSILPGHAWVGTAWIGPAGGVVAVVVARAFQVDPRPPTIAEDAIAVFAGVGVWVVVWFFSALFYAPFTSPEKANARSHGELINKLAVLVARKRALCDWPSSPANSSDPAIPLNATVESACREAEDHLDWVKNEISSPAGEFRWVNGTGYIALQERLHRAEEALLKATPEDHLLDEELFDELRLKDSTIPNRDDLMSILRVVKKYLSDRKADPSADPYIDSSEKAASVMAKVRYSINDFRDSSWNGLLQLRNQTMTTVLLTNITLFAFASAAVFSGAKREAMLSATVFLLIGAAVGFFNRLNSQFQAQSAVEDFGLTNARLITIPAYSGLAAVAGVVITSVAGVATGNAYPNLNSLFTLPPGTGLLVVAAAFGAAPDLVLSRLGDASEKFKNGIASTEPGRRQTN